jgi:hypothetical protein
MNLECMLAIGLKWNSHVCRSRYDSEIRHDGRPKPAHVLLGRDDGRLLVCA